MKNRKIGWKVYFVIFSLLLLIVYYDLISKGLTMYVFADIVISLTASTGLFGYIFNKKIYKQFLWRIWLFVIISWDLIYALYLTPISGVAQGGIDIYTFSAFILILPVYVALYLYGYKSNTLWENKNIP